MYTLGGSTAGIPLIVHIAYQMMFAIITPALITGAFANRVTFKAYMLFLTAWLIFVYFPFCHMVWHPEGILAKWGVLDFAGGIVVHNTAGLAALASILYVGKRKVVENDAPQHPPHRPGHGPPVVRLVRLQRRLRVPGRLHHRLCLPEHRRGRLLRGRHLALRGVGQRRASPSSWACSRAPWPASPPSPPARAMSRRPPRLSSASSPACICYYAVALKNRLGWDDALDVWGVHGVGGFIGVIFLGIFASKAWNPNGADGLLQGNPAFFGKQLVAVAVSSVWAFVFTYGMLWIIDRITPVRVSEEQEQKGLDAGLHGEEAYPQGL